MLRTLLIWTLFYLGCGVSTAAFLFHLPAARRGLDPDRERLRIARSVPALERLRAEAGEEAARRAVAVGIVLLWPLFVVPLLRWAATRRP